LPPDFWTVFDTPCGWAAILQDDVGVWRVLIGHARADDVQAALPPGARRSQARTPLAARIQAYFAGVRDDFADVPIAARWSTPFQQAVVRAVRRVGYGATITYAELAQRAGHPGAARAAGRVMATNPVPLLVPCHRVLGSGGSLGGFSAPAGLALKQQMLELERPSQRSAKGAGEQTRRVQPLVLTP
jgi:methylated-DNA-[protein]-cysteine S-methyltransferase